jgi:adenosine deaminase
VDVKKMVLAGFKSSFLPFHEKQLMLRRVGAELARYDSEGHLLPESTPPPFPTPSDDVP